MKNRINLVWGGERIFLPAVIHAPKYHIQKQPVLFVVDTGSPSSFFSHQDVVRLQIPVKGKKAVETIMFGGSKYQVIKMNVITLMTKCDQGVKEFKGNFKALKTSVQAERKAIVASALPSILGLDFLQKHNLSLHIYPDEKLAYLQIET